MTTSTKKNHTAHFKILRLMTCHLDVEIFFNKDLKILLV